MGLVFIHFLDILNAFNWFHWKMFVWKQYMNYDDSLKALIDHILRDLNKIFWNLLWSHETVWNQAKLERIFKIGFNFSIENYAFHEIYHVSLFSKNSQHLGWKNGKLVMKLDLERSKTSSSVFFSWLEKKNTFNFSKFRPKMGFFAFLKFLT